MNPVKFLFFILSRFNLIDASEYAKLQDEANHWWNSLRTDDEKDKKDGKTHPFLKAFKLHGEKWYIRLFIALLTIPTVRWVRDMLNPVPDEELD